MAGLSSDFRSTSERSGISLKLIFETVLIQTE